MIIFLLDRSGSMNERLDETIDGFNTFVEEQDLDETLTLYTFSDTLHMEYKNVKISNVLPLTKDTYIPCGNTALYDSIGKILSDHENECGTLVILTDGHENSSKKYTKSHIKDLIKFSRMHIIYAGPEVEDFDSCQSFKYDGHSTPETFRILSQHIKYL